MIYACNNCSNQSHNWHTHRLKPFEIVQSQIKASLKMYSLATCILFIFLLLKKVGQLYFTFLPAAQSKWWQEDWALS